MTLGPSSVSVYRLFKSDMLFGMAMRTSNGINDQRRREGRWVLIAVLRSYLHVSFGDRRQASPLLQRPGSGSPGSASGRKHLTLPCLALHFLSIGWSTKFVGLFVFFVSLFLFGSCQHSYVPSATSLGSLQTGFSTIPSITSIDRYLPVGADNVSCQVHNSMANARPSFVMSRLAENGAKVCFPH